MSITEPDELAADEEVSASTGNKNIDTIESASSNSENGDDDSDYEYYYPPTLKERYARLKQNKYYQMFWLMFGLYAFILAINTMGHGFKSMGSGFTNALLGTIQDPISAFCIGILATALVQSSSATTAILVTLCVAQDPAGNPILPVELAIPAVMGANVGTAVTNAIVSLGHATRKEEFRRAFGGALVHHYFNILAVAILLPIELIWHPLLKMATFMQEGFVGVGGLKVASPVKVVTAPVINSLDSILAGFGDSLGLAFIIVGAVFLILGLKLIVDSMRFFMVGKGEKLIKDYLFRGPTTSFVIALTLTAVVQSSSITTSIIVPLLGAGVLSIRKILPYTVGANIGTTVTAILAALAAGGAAGVTLAFVHLLFNVSGCSIIYFIKPLRKIPIWLGEKAGDIVVSGKRGFTFMVFGMVGGVSYIFPITYLLIAGLI